MSDCVPLVEALEGYFDKSLKEMPDALRRRVVTQFAPIGWDKCTPGHRRRLSKQLDTPPGPEITEDERQTIGESIDREAALIKQYEKWEMVDTPTARDLEIQEVKVGELSREIAAMEERRLITRGDYYPEPPNVKPQAKDAQSPSSKPCAEFRAMKKLTADELSISFVGDKDESGMGANNMLEISAQGVSRRVPLAALDLVDRRNGQLNHQGAVLLGMAQKRYPKRTGSIAKTMSRLRKVFLEHLGINSDPFHPYRKGTGWVPHFKIDDKRGAADERAKREAERRTVSFEQLMESGEKAGDKNQTPQPHGSEIDTEGWMQMHGHSWEDDNDPDVPA